VANHDTNTNTCILLLHRSIGSSLPLPILIHGVPRVGAKSRVETQVKMTLDLVAHPHANDPSPSTYERVGSWKYLRLPKGTSTRRRARKDPKIGESCWSYAVLCVCVCVWPIFILTGSCSL
jgi:hypothetical protein